MRASQRERERERESERATGLEDEDRSKLIQGTSWQRGHQSSRLFIMSEAKTLLVTILLP